VELTVLVVGIVVVSKPVLVLTTVVVVSVSIVLVVGTTVVENSSDNNGRPVMLVEVTVEVAVTRTVVVEGAPVEPLLTTDVEVTVTTPEVVDRTVLVMVSITVVLTLTVLVPDAAETVVFDVSSFETVL
jgi:hypothetical protein